MIALSVNLNKIALIRNSREGDYPSVLEHAKICLAAGADGITVHPRPDQRHIRPRDVRQLAELLSSHPGVEFNIEGNPMAPAQGDYPGFLALVMETHPQQCTLVPDSNDQLTSDHGFDLDASGAALEPIIRRLRDNHMRVSLFMDPDKHQVRLAKEVGADRIEFYTGPYAAAWGHAEQLERLLERYTEAANLAVEIGLGINAGHDLNLENLQRFRHLPGLLEVSIGHAFTVDSLAMGMARATQAYKAILAGRELPSFQA
jgi:pyridoxine 5-phosphate synthase